MAFGDSLTEGESLGALRMFPTHDPGGPGIATSYPARLRALLAARYTSQTFAVFNGGAGGATASDPDELERFKAYMREYVPQLVILMHGVNDLNGGTDFGSIITAIEAMIRDAQGRGIQVLLSTLPRQRPGAKRAFAVERIEPFNDELRDTAFDMGVPLVDIFPHITVDMLTPDGLHITPAGNDKLAELYFSELQARYEIAPGG